MFTVLYFKPLFQAGYRSDNSTIVEISLKNAEKTVHL